MRKTYLLTTIAALLTLGATAQTESATRGTGSQVAQPNIMVVPYFTTSAAQIEESMAKDPNVAFYVGIVREAFNKKGFQCKDFFGVQNSSNLMSELRNNAQEDKFTQILTANQIDMYVKVNVIPGKDSRGNFVNLALSCVEFPSGASIADKTQNSGSYRDAADSKLVELALQDVIDDFMVQMQGAFDVMMESGRSLKIDFAISNNSQYTFYDPVGEEGVLLAQAIVEWIEDNAYNGRYNQQSMDDKLLIFSEVSVPVRDLKTNRPYNLNTFAFGLIGKLSKLGVRATPKTTGQGIVFTIQ